MIFPQFVIYVLIYDYLKFRKDPSITSQEIANYISVALAVALSVYLIFCPMISHVIVLMSGCLLNQQNCLCTMRGLISASNPRMIRVFAEFSEDSLRLYEFFM